MVYFDQRDQKVVCVYLSGLEALDKKLGVELAKLSTKETPILTLSKALKLANVDERKLHTFGTSIGAALRAAFPLKYAYQHNFLIKKTKEENKEEPDKKVKEKIPPTKLKKEILTKKSKEEV